MCAFHWEHNPHTRNYTNKANKQNNYPFPVMCQLSIARDLGVELNAPIPYSMLGICLH